MGCYMSTPDNRVYVSEGKGHNFKYATASCQGWRREQEDAEACIPYFDDSSSLFILCDGHGGAEVAKYTVEHLPDFIKNHPLYKEGKYPEALRQSFIDFDKLLRTDKVMEELHKLAFDEEEKNEQNEKESKLLDLEEQILEENIRNRNSTNEANSAGGSSGSSSSAGPSSSKATSSRSNGPTSVVEDVDSETLRKEAQLPLRQVIEQYSACASAIDPAKRSSLLSKFNSSPVVRAKKEDAEDLDDDEGATTNGEDQAGPSSSSYPEGSITTESIKESLIRQVLQHYFKDDDSSDDSEFNGDESSDDDDGDDEGDDDGTDSSSKKLRKKKHKRPLDSNESSSDDNEDDDENSWRHSHDDESDETSDDEETSEEDEDEENDDDEEGDEEEEDEDEEVDENKVRLEDDDKDLEREDEDDDQWEDISNMVRPGARAHKPGLDSGCTVVVALLVGSRLYVASAGDSRCIIVLKGGTGKPMSFDHKPEDPIERKRIHKAGGRITDGRVNGGLNLSRAMGDFSYKNPELDPTEQMISPEPDVRTAEINQDVEYIFLACDGIWNSMKNQQVAKFINKLAPNSDEDLVDICVKIFRRCIAPKTDGDGTGCDNMTCILARINCNADDYINSSEKEATKCDLNKEQIKSTETTTTNDEISKKTQKRSTSNEDESSGDKPNKRRCIRL